MFENMRSPTHAAQKIPTEMILPSRGADSWLWVYASPNAYAAAAAMPNLALREIEQECSRWNEKKYPYFETCFYHGIVSSWSLYSTSIRSLEDGMPKAILASCQLRPELHAAVVNIPDLRWASLGMACPKWAHDRSLMSPTQLDRSGRLKHTLFHVGRMNACRRCWELSLWQKAAATITVYCPLMLHDVIPALPLNLCP